MTNNPFITKLYTYFVYNIFYINEVRKFNYNFKLSKSSNNSNLQGLP